MRPLLSVILPVYNAERFIAAALESVRQNYDDHLEVVLVDNGSSDRTLEIVEGFARVMPIRVIAPGRSLGNWTASSNVGLREATGEWACFLHHDDLWLQGRIARLRSAMEGSNGPLILHNSIFIGPYGQTLGPWTCPLPAGEVPSSTFIERLLVQNFVAIVSPVFRREAAVDSGGLDGSLWFSADWDLWLRLGAMGPVHFIKETLSAYRVHPASQTMARKLLPNEWEQQLTTVLARHLPTWAATGRNSDLVEQVALASIAVNCAFSAASRGEPVRPSPAIRALLALGPRGWHRYFRDSRIVQRIRSRLKVHGAETD